MSKEDEGREDDGSESLPTTVDSEGAVDSDDDDDDDDDEEEEVDRSEEEREDIEEPEPRDEDGRSGRSLCRRR
jgi:hypothetical protein